MTALNLKPLKMRRSHLAKEHLLLIRRLTTRLARGKDALQSLHQDRLLFFLLLLLQQTNKLTN